MHGVFMVSENIIFKIFCCSYGIKECFLSDWMYFLKWIEKSPNSWKNRYIDFLGTIIMLKYMLFHMFDYVSSTNYTLKLILKKIVTIFLHYLWAPLCESNS